MRARSASTPARAATWARATSDSTLRTSAWLRMRTTSSAAHFSGLVPMAANSGERRDVSASDRSMKALIPAAKASVIDLASGVP